MDISRSHHQNITFKLDCFIVDKICITNANVCTCHEGVGRTTSLSVVVSAASGLEVGGGVGGGSAGLGPDCARNTATPPPPSQRRGTQLPCSSARQSPAPAPAAEYHQAASLCC